MAWRRGRRTGDEDAGQEPEEEAPMGEGGDAWEYLVEDGDVASDRLERRCNELGWQGWELVSVASVSRLALSAGGRTTGTRLFFKRRLP